MSNAKHTVDPVTVEIIRNGLIAVTEEMKTNLMRTAYNLIVYEALDFTVGLFTAEGDTISIGLGLPMFIRGMAEAVKAKIRHFAQESIHPGDILITNDGYITGSHLNHVTLTMPYFHNGKVSTLDEAIRLMSDYQLGRPLTPADIKSIMTWLNTLTGDIPADYVKEPALPPSTDNTPKPVS